MTLKRRPGGVGIRAVLFSVSPIYNHIMGSPRKTNRRDFLRGWSAVRAIEDLLPDESLVDPTRNSIAAERSQGAATYLLQVARTAMACEFQVFLNAGQHPAATEVALESLDLVDALEDQLTVYRDHSEISRLNQSAADGPVAVERGLFDLLQNAATLSEGTGGAFDITAGPLTKVWGFHRREGRYPAPETLREARQFVGSQWLELDPDASTVRFQRAGLEINLGAIGKGYALDRCEKLFRSRGIDDFLIHGGRSSVLAAGSREDSTHAGRGWSIAVQHPLRPEWSLGELWLRDRACGTSSSGNQFFHFDGKRYGHVIDPRSGYPANQLLSATVLAPTAAEADALSTACFVMGPEAARSYIEQRPQLAAILIRAGAQAGSIELLTLGMADDQWRPADDPGQRKSGGRPTSPN